MLGQILRSHITQLQLFIIQMIRPEQLLHILVDFGCVAADTQSSESRSPSVNAVGGLQKHARYPCARACLKMQDEWGFYLEEQRTF